MLRKLSAELFGTFWLVFGGCGSAVLAAAFPEAMSEVSQATHLLSTMARSGGIRLDKETTEQIAQAQSRHSSSTRGALWVGAVALVVLALSQAL